MTEDTTLFDLTTVGFVGLGRMGLPMAANLDQAGRNVIAYDVAPAARAGAAELAGAVTVNTPREVGEQAQVVVTMLPNGAIVRDSVLGENGIARGLRSGGVIIDMSSSAPWETQSLAHDLDALGIRLVDAPVSGGVARAKTGELAVFAGGDDTTIDEIEPVLTDLGRQVHRTGGTGTGHAAKALNNLLSAACFAATIEVLRIAEGFGIEPATMAEVLNSATGKNNATEHKLRQFVLSETYASGFALDLMVKDLRQSSRIADDVSLDVPLSREVIRLWTAGADELGATADHTEIARTLARPDGGTP